MRLILATVVTLLTSTNAVVTAGTSVKIKASIDSLNVVGATSGEQRLLRIHKSDSSTQIAKSGGLALTEERTLPAVTKMKQKIFRLKMKVVMPSIKKILQDVVESLIK
ncbi:hypothetical protein ON010_g1767 [Phytophthora cinnamomi]|nr:hypothetical protein ON010_g1767 [Phytophthora cinnamomi]